MCQQSAELTLRRLSLPSLAALYTTLLKSIFTYSGPRHVGWTASPSSHVERTRILVVQVDVVDVVDVVDTPEN